MTVKKSTTVEINAGEIKAQAEAHINDAVELSCCACGAWIGYVYERDLSGSFFYCGDCVEEKKNGGEVSN